MWMTPGCGLASSPFGLIGAAAPPALFSSRLTLPLRPSGSSGRPRHLPCSPLASPCLFALRAHRGARAPCPVLLSPPRGSALRPHRGARATCPVLRSPHPASSPFGLIGAAAPPALFSSLLAPRPCPSGSWGRPPRSLLSPSMLSSRIRRPPHPALHRGVSAGVPR